jgi:hypothetical protein
MKKIVFALLLLLSVKSAMAQKDSLSFDEHNKYIYYHVVEQPGLTADTFQNRMQYLLKAVYPKNKINPGGTPGSISGTGKFLLLTGITAAKHVDGEIAYTFHIEYKDQKYRYWLTDFVFTPYKVDRYGNSVPEQGLDIPLKQAAAKLEKNQFSTYLTKTAIYSIQFGGDVKKYMMKISATPAKDDKKKVNITKDW